MKRRTISKSEYLQLVGLFTLARRHVGIVENCQEEGERILGVSDHESFASHFSDAIYNADDSVDAALNRMGVTVEERDDDRA